MKKIVILALLLSGCATHYVPVKGPQIPDLPLELAHKAPALPPITDPSMGGLAITVAQDSQAYNGVAWQLNGLIDVYNCVKDAINKDADVKKCLK